MNSRTDIELEIDFTGAVLVRWSGQANHRRPGTALQPTFEKLLSLGRYLRFDFSELEHMSSSTLVVVLKFFKQLNSKGVGYDLCYDEGSSWQRLTFAQLEALTAQSGVTVAA